MAYNTGSTLTHFIPAVWAAELMVKLRSSLVYAGPGVVNRDYEGEIRGKGSSVKITQLSDPTIGDYTEHTEFDVEQLSDTQQELLIDTAKFFAYKVDDIEHVQVLNDGGMMSQAMQNAAYGLAAAADAYVSGLMKSGVAAANQAATADFTATTPASAYEAVLLPLKLKLDKANVPPMGRWLVASPELESQLLQDDRFVRVDASGSSEGLRNGMIGRAAGFDILMTNAVPSVAATSTLPGTQTIVAGYSGAFSYAEQIQKVETTRIEKGFGDIVKGLHVYGGKLVRPEGIATCEITVTGPTG